MITYISPINLVAEDNHLYFAYKSPLGFLCAVYKCFPNPTSSPGGWHPSCRCFGDGGLPNPQPGVHGHHGPPYPGRVHQHGGRVRRLCLQGHRQEPHWPPGGPFLPVCGHAPGGYLTLTGTPVELRFSKNFFWLS